MSIDWSEIEARVSRMTSTPEHLELDDNLLQWSPPVVSDSSDADSDDDSVRELEVSLFILFNPVCWTFNISFMSVLTAFNITCLSVV